MQDPTNRWLDAALLDQVVAGKFHGRPYAFVPVMRGTGKPWGIGVACEGEHGYWPVQHDAFAWDKRDEAHDFCVGMNRHIGISPLREAEIIVSSMRKPNKLRLTVSDD